MSLPRVSIIVPVYNGKKFLEETVRSVLEQTFTDWELLLIDDGSSDGSEALARQYEATYPEKVRSLVHPARANHGQLATRVFAARHARADLIALLDQDDVWDRDYLEKHLQVWEAAQAEGAYLSYGPALYWFPDDPTGHKEYVQPMPPGAPKVYAPGVLLESYLTTLYADTPCPSCALLRREVLDHVGQYEEVAKGSPCEDQYLWWHIAARWPVAVHRGAWARYRQHAVSAFVQFSASAEHARNAELTFLNAVRENLLARDPAHPLLATGQLTARMQSVTNQDLAERLAKQDAAAQELAARLAEREATAQQLAERLAEREAAVANLAARLAEHQAAVQRHEAVTQELSARLEEQEKASRRLQAQLQEVLGYNAYLRSFTGTVREMPRAALRAIKSRLARWRGNSTPR